MTKKTYIIIDGNSFIHRAYHALPAFTNKAGFPTQIITGVCNMINKVLNGFEHERAVIAFDARGKNFRHEMFSDYKANRESMPEDMRVQLKPLKEIIEAWGLPMLTIDGVEADDSMSTLALMAEAEGYDEVIMSTSDKDMAQIVNKHISILDTKSTESKEKLTLMNIEGVEAKMGVIPELVVDFLALVGDKADNVPGVEKCGPKTAIKWLESYGNIEGIIENADKIGGKVGEYLANSIESGELLLSQKLVTIKKDVDVGKKASEFTGVMNEEKLLELLNVYEMRNFKKTLGLVDKNAESAHVSYNINENDVNAFVKTLKNLPIVFMKTFSYDNKDYLLATSQEAEEIYVLDPEKHVIDLAQMVDSFIKNDFYISSLDSKDVLKTIYKQVKDRKVFDILLDDARVVNYVQEGGLGKEAAIEVLNDKHSNFNLSELREEYKLNGKSPKWNKMSIEETITVLCEEVKIAKYIINNKDDDFDIHAAVMDNRLLGALAYVEFTGALLNVEYLKDYGEELSVKIEALEKNIFSIAGKEFSLGSPKQVADILFNVLEIESKKKSTSEDVLLALVEDNPVVGDILKWRSLSKLKSTYVEGLVSRVDEFNFIHTNYHSTLTKTSRLSSTDPNLQNIPVKTEEGQRIRNAFIAREGYKIVALDYSQIELRILAHLSRDKKLLEAYLQGIDLHSLTASQIFEIDIEDVTKEQRRIGKTINFGLIYGMSERRLAAELGIDKKEASIYYRNYFRYFKEVKPYFEAQLESAKENLFIRTITGRKIPTADVLSPNPHARSHAEKAANNAGIQGTAADVMKAAMIKAFEVLQETRIEANILMQIYDELIFEVREDMVEAFANKMKTLMENTTQISVPLIVDCEIRDHY